MSPYARPLLVVTLSCLTWNAANAETTVFFNNCQVATLVNSGVTSDTVSSRGYLFTYTRDKLFTGGTGQPIGRQVRVPWPQGVEAQAVTTPAPPSTDYKAHLDIERVDGTVFDLPAFTFQLLANTGGAGASLEIMPTVNGEDAFADPIYFDATGFYSQHFSYDTSPNPWGSTALLVGFEKYKITLYVDFAFTAITLDAAVPGDQACCLPDFSCAEIQPDACLTQGGTSQGLGSTCPCTTCLAAGIPAASSWGLVAFTLLLLAGGSAILHHKKPMHPT